MKLGIKIRTGNTQADNSGILQHCQHPLDKLLITAASYP